MSHKVLTILFVLGLMCHSSGRAGQPASPGAKAGVKSDVLPGERSLPNGSLYDSQLKRCFSNAIPANLDSSNVWICGAVRKPQILKLGAHMTVGAAISKCGGFEKAFCISIYRRSGERFSLITIGLVADFYNPTGYERIRLRKDDLIVVSQEGF